MKNCLVIGGPLYGKNVFSQLLDTCRQFPAIVSTWDDEPDEKISVLKEICIDVIISKKPTYNGIQNINFANFSLVNGFLRAKELEFTHVLRFRTDLYSPNIEKMVKIFSDASSEKIVAICWFNHYVQHSPHGYIMDHVMYGPVDGLINYRNVYQKIGDKEHTEAFLQNNFFKKTPKYEDVKNKVCFVLDELVNGEVKIFFNNRHASDTCLFLQYKNLGSMVIGA